MVGPVISSPAQSGQIQNNAAQHQAEVSKGAAQVEQRDPRPDEIQRREAPAAQSQSSAEQNPQAPRAEDQTSNQELTASALAANQQNEPPVTENRGEIIDVMA
jgi:hypothetical protein